MHFLAISTFVLAVGFAMVGGAAHISKSPCQAIRDADVNAPSAVYKVTVKHHEINVYCEMGLGNAPYTFLSPASLTVLKNADLQAMFVDRTSFLMRVRMTNGVQTYGVLKQLPANSNIPLKLSINENNGYATPLNAALLDNNYLYFGFQPIAAIAKGTVQGLQVNGASITFTNCDGNPNSHITLHPNFHERTPTTYGLTTDFPFCNNVFGSTIRNPSARVMPDDFFMFTELHWGGCGCYSQTDSRLLNKGILSTAIGFR